MGQREVVRPRQLPLHERGASVEFGDIRAIDLRMDRLPAHSCCVFVRASCAVTCKPLPPAPLRVPLSHPARTGFALERGLVRG